MVSNKKEKQARHRKCTRCGMVHLARMATPDPYVCPWCREHLAGKKHPY
jgi:ribosomal protein L37AE/L43A